MHWRGGGEWARALFPMRCERRAVCRRLHAKKRRLATTLTIHAHFLHNCSGRVRTTCCASRSQDDNRSPSSRSLFVALEQKRTSYIYTLCHLAFVWTLKLILNTCVLFAQHALGLLEDTPFPIGLIKICTF